MSKEISLSINCNQSCTLKHLPGKDHTFIQIRKFKHKLTEFLSIDDQHWLPAFEVLNQLDELINTVSKLKSQFDDKIVQKRLLYALNFQSDRKILNTFKLANCERFESLSCEDVALIMKKIDKARNPKASQIKNLISNLMKEQKLKLTEKISQCFARFKDNEETEIFQKLQQSLDRQQQNQNAERQVRRQRNRNYKRVNQPSEKEQKNKDLPTVKIDEIQATEGHFNITIKVIKVKKEFILGENNRKIQFEGGDQTGQAIVVVDCLKMVKTGAVIKINNAKVYSFHGVKQIQQNLKNSFLQQINKDIKVNDNYNFSTTKTRRQNREPRELREPREKIEKNIHRQPRQARKEREDREEREPPITRTRLDRTDRTDRFDRSDRPSKNQTQNITYAKRQQQLKSIRNRDENQKLQINRQLRKREVSKRQQKSGQCSDDQPEESQQEQNNKGLNKRQIVEVHQNSKLLTKIKDINPEMDNISLMAEIVSIGKISPNLQLQVSQNKVFTILGDQTGTIWAQLPQNNLYVLQNSVIFLKNVEVHVHQVQAKLILRVGENSVLQKTSMRMPKINLQNDMSEQVWLQQQSEDEQQEQQSKKIVYDF